MIPTANTLLEINTLYTDVLSMMIPEEARWMFLSEVELQGNSHKPLIVLCFKNSQNNKLFSIAVYIGSDNLFAWFRGKLPQDGQDHFRSVKYKYLGIKG